MNGVIARSRTFMYAAFGVLLALCVAVGACGGHEAASPSNPSAIASVRTPLQIKVMTFNIQHGIDGTEKYNLQRAIETIARVRPDIVGMQEVTRNHPFYACDDQPARMASGVERATGLRWTATYQQEWFTPDVSCQQNGRGDGPETEGLVLLTPRAMTSASMTALPNSRIGYGATIADAYGVPVLVTHLTSGASNGAVRSQQIDRLLGWAGGFGEPRIVVGDFNAAPDTAEMSAITSTYRDAWQEAQRIGRAIGTPFGHRSTRIDYIFYVPGTSLTLESAEFIDTTALLGVEASDHKPFVATFTVR